MSGKFRRIWRGLYVVREFFFPILEFDDLEEIKEERKSEIKAIVGIMYQAHTDYDRLIEEARRVYDEEEKRRELADSRATNFLMMAAALITILTYLDGVLWGRKVEAVTGVLSIILFVAVAYTGIFGFLAFKVFGFKAYSRLGPLELMELSFSKPEKRQAALLLKNIVAAVRFNQDVVNNKLSWVGLSRDYLLRAFVAFCLFVLVNCAYSAWESFFSEDGSGGEVISSASDTPQKGSIRLDMASFSLGVPDPVQVENLKIEP